MYRHIQGVALRTVRYNDNKSILTAWTSQLGRVSLLMPSTSSRESRRRRALTMPMSLFEAEADVKPGREIMSVRDMRPAVVTASVSADVSKATVAIFMAEFLDNMLREAAVGDEALWKLIVDTVTALDQATQAAAIANMHIWFLYRLCVVAGVEPDMSTYGKGRVFDMRSGTFRNSAPGHSDYLESSEAEAIAVLQRLTPRSLHLFRLTGARRATALDVALRYCALHGLHSSGNMHSTEILRAVFRD
ncbi:MAG: recombination protein O N-terminal domain-containing protein [Bacteroidales bacterium]|nr:recombination protein O N-terminal domain-containing protein [Bacteroidales bacterium]